LQGLELGLELELELGLELDLELGLELELELELGLGLGLGLFAAWLVRVRVLVWMVQGSGMEWSEVRVEVWLGMLPVAALWMWVEEFEE
jgi:hypothetical protein